MLIGKEEVFMDILWDCGKPMSSMDIIRAAPVGTWGEKSDKNIHRIIRQLIKKGWIEVCGQVQSGTQYARLFQPAITREAYAIKQLSDFESNSLVKIALGLTKVAKKNADNGIDKEVIDELEIMLQEFRESNKDNSSNNKGNI